jgi:hypothetical protein
MGADLYLPSFKENREKCQKNFDSAVESRDRIFPRYFDGVNKINAYVLRKMNRGEANFGDDMVEIPENMTLPAEFEPMRERYNQFVKAQARVNKWYNKMYEVGYFRDSYNGTSLFRRLGLSWWGCKYIENGVISPENAQKLLDEVEQVELEPITKEELEENHCRVDDGENSPVTWNKMFSEKKACFVSFLKEAIDNHWSIEASV